MRRRNWRVVFTGAALMLLALMFFLWMLTLAPQSNDPAELMRIVGMVAGAGGGLGLFMIVFGLLRR